MGLMSQGDSGIKQHLLQGDHMQKHMLASVSQPGAPATFSRQSHGSSVVSKRLPNSDYCFYGHGILNAAFEVL